MQTLTREVRSADWPSGPAGPGALMMLLHGYGSNERGLAGLAPSLSLGLPWVSLRAPLDTPGGGAAWFAITTPGDPDAVPVEEATDVIWSWVDANVEPGTRIVPVGFSQGGLMATQLLRSRPERVLAPVVLGGFVLGATQPGDGVLASERPAAFWGRGEDDYVITGPAVARTASWLPRHASLEERIYAGLGHGISAQELADVHSFLLENVPSV